VNVPSVGSAAKAKWAHSHITTIAEQIVARRIVGSSPAGAVVSPATGDFYSAKLAKQAISRGFMKSRET
jgi:hypothetical protein